jgi:hypothetical protein
MIKHNSNPFTKYDQEVSTMLGKIHVWKMSEEERLAYIAKHPIIKKEKKKEKGTSYSNIHEMKKKKK